MGSVVCPTTARHRGSRFRLTQLVAPRGVSFRSTFPRSLPRPGLARHPDDVSPCVFPGRPAPPATDRRAATAHRRPPRLFAGPIIAREVITAPRPIRFYLARAAYVGL